MYSARPWLVGPGEKEYSKLAEDITVRDIEFALHCCTLEDAAELSKYLVEMITQQKFWNTDVLLHVFLASVHGAIS